jgi:tetratricopeptide (TPR) repeat protein
VHAEARINHMSVYRRILGRELPCSSRELLAIPCLSGISNAGHPDSPAGLYRAGMLHLYRNQPGLARMRLADAVRRDGADIPARLGLAAACEMLSRHEESAQQIEAAVDAAGAEDTSRPIRLCAAGFSLERAGLWRQSIQRYNAALLASPSELFAHNRLAAIHLAHGHGAEAAIHLRAVLYHHPADQATRSALAHLLQREGRHREAVWEYEQALCLEPDTWEMPVASADELCEAASPAQAIRVLESLVSSQPHFPDLRVRLARLYSQCGDDDRASRQFGSALAMHPDYLDCRIAAARHELRMGRPELAIEHLQRAVAINDQHVEVYAALAMAQRRCGQAHSAADTLASAGRIASNSAVLLTQLGMLELEQEELVGRGWELTSDLVEQVLEHNRLLVDMHPSWMDLRLHQARLQRLLGRTRTAYQTLRALVLDDPAMAEAWLHLGLILQGMGRDEDAGSALANALQLDPPMARLQYQLGLACCGELEFDLAMEQLERSCPRPRDIQRRIWTEIETMQLASGPRSPSRDSRTGPLVTEQR